MGKSKIQWCDSTWNPVRGCTKISPGCKNCYAETFAERWRGVAGHPYEQGFDLKLVPEKLDEPLRWRKPQRVFVNSMSDLFQEGVPFEFVLKVFATMAAAEWHTFQVLTKRADRMKRFFEWHKKELSLFAEVWPIPNIWLGVSAENQKYVDERVPLLLQTPAAKRFISYEPGLGLIDLNFWGVANLDWVIVGGESGPGARPFSIMWARHIVNQCKHHGVAVFVKQLGGNIEFSDEFTAYRHTKAGIRCHTYSRKGDDPAEWPADLRIQEFPS